MKRFQQATSRLLLNPHRLLLNPNPHRRLLSGGASTSFAKGASTTGQTPTGRHQGGGQQTRESSGSKEGDRQASEKRCREIEELALKKAEESITRQKELVE